VISFLNPARLMQRETLLRPLEEQDCVAISDIHATGFDPAWGPEDMMGLLRQSNVFGFLALETGALIRQRPVGFVLVRHAADEAEILTIAVSSQARGRGIGRRLMVETLRKLYADRIDRLILEVDENNQSALHLYRQLGFEQVGVRKGYYTHAEKRKGVSGGTALVMACNVR
jgi:ribosomal-protein-alanine N-acetyltransferase